MFTKGIVRCAFRRIHHPPPIMAYTSQLEPMEPSSKAIPAFQLLDLDGTILNESLEPKVLCHTILTTS